MRCLSAISSGIALWLLMSVLLSFSRYSGLLSSGLTIRLRSCRWWLCGYVSAASCGVLGQTDGVRRWGCTVVVRYRIVLLCASAKKDSQGKREDQWLEHGSFPSKFELCADFSAGQYVL